MSGAENRCRVMPDLTEKERARLKGESRMRNNRRFIGTEKDGEYFAKSVGRVEGLLARPRGVGDAP